ncbi:hypothetical protein BDY21DRAFT_277974 [Lineolata rhizophorae]|uniref:Uncharacterized protein n=1 Tax=Lineolata rhizophorae TaxID=578093 RepID=A0A6A6PG18_9PEZI|nr:hypothetical protein BDY21DRAFT_277974 [Lineolata rhizophorae]
MKLLLPRTSVLAIVTLAAASLLALHPAGAAANVEKAVFTAPAAVPFPHAAHPDLDDLRLDVLAPAAGSSSKSTRTGSSAALRLRLPVRFPSEDAPRGESSWYVVDGLEEGRRYEVRVCWVATQPTQFWLDTFDLPTVFQTPELITSLADYSEVRQTIVPLSAVDSPPEREPPLETAKPVSLLFLQLHAAADFYSSNQTLMRYPPPVDVDLILDPYILDVLPCSLAPTALYIIALGLGTYFLSGAITRWLGAVASSSLPAHQHPHVE